MAPESGKRAFTLIELLVVIAVIAVLVAILFPTFLQVKKRATEAACMSNLRQIYTAVKLYAQDNSGVYPETLYGFAENTDGSYNTTGTGAVPATHILRGYLYRKQINDAQVFHCPANDRDPNRITTAHFPPQPPSWPTKPDGTPYSYVEALGPPSGPCPRDEAGVVDCFLSGPLLGQPKYYYAHDSYDIGPRVDADGRMVTSGGEPVYDVHYSRDWTAATGTDDLPSQLKYPNPPDDRTMLTYCTWHRAVAGSDMIISISLAGSVKPVPYALILQHGANLYNR